MRNFLYTFHANKDSLRCPPAIESQRPNYFTFKEPRNRFQGIDSASYVARARIVKLLRSPKIDSKKPIPPGCVAWRDGTTTLFLLGS
jgi:hypothetical protein